MKKTYMVLLALASSAFALSNAEIMNIYKENAPSDVNISIDSRMKIDGFDGYEAVVLDIVQGTQSGMDILITKDNYIFPDIVDLKNNVSARQQVEQKLIAQKLSETYKSESKDNIISLGNDTKKETLVIFSDPECPYCRKELESIEQKLKTNNVEFILTPVHDVSSLEKSALIYKDIKKAKTDDDKIKVIRKYFAQDVKYDKVDEKEVQKINDLRQKYAKAGVRGVPFIINKKEISK